MRFEPHAVDPVSRSSRTKRLATTLAVAAGLYCGGCAAALAQPQGAASAPAAPAGSAARPGQAGAWVSAKLHAWFKRAPASAPANASAPASAVAPTTAAAAASTSVPAATSPAAPASAPGGVAALGKVLGGVGGWFRHVVAPTAPASAPAGAASAAPVASTNRPSSAASAAGHPGLAGAAAALTDVVDIDSVADRADVQFDPQCKVLVQPFAFTDNVASLGLYVGKAELASQVGSLLGKAPRQQVDAPHLIRLAAMRLNWMPMAVEVKLGEQRLSEMQNLILREDRNRQSRLEYANARHTLAEVLAQIHQPVPYHFRIYVRRASGGNAQALPGGILLVDADIVAGHGYDRTVAFFKIAHEVSHVLQRHETRRYQARLVDGFTTLAQLQNVLTQARGNPLALLPMASGLKQLFINFTQQQELQADACAFRLLRQRDPDRQDMAAAVRDIENSLGPLPAQGIAPQAPTLVAQLHFLSDGRFERHPNSQERESHLAQLLAQMPVRPPGQVHAEAEH